MEILKSIRDNFGLSQQNMASLLGIPRNHYSMVETGRRILPAEPAQKFAELLSLFQQKQPMPPLPDKVPEPFQKDVQMLLIKAKLQLFEAEKAVETCTMHILQQQNLEVLTSRISAFFPSPMPARIKNTVDELAYKKEKLQQHADIGHLVILQAQLQICRQTVKILQQIQVATT